MDCPLCKEPMIVLELQGIEIDYCQECSGIWLDSGELELLLEDSGKKNDLLSSFTIASNTKEKKHKCPICLKKMDKISCGTYKKVLLDKCSFGDGIWFDNNELQEVISRGSLDKNNKVLDFLQDMFNKTK